METRESEVKRRFVRSFKGAYRVMMLFAKPCTVLRLMANHRDYLLKELRWREYEVLEELKEISKLTKNRDGETLLRDYATKKGIII